MKITIDLLKLLDAQCHIDFVTRNKLIGMPLECIQEINRPNHMLFCYDGFFSWLRSRACQEYAVDPDGRLIYLRGDLYFYVIAYTDVITVFIHSGNGKPSVYTMDYNYNKLSHGYTDYLYDNGLLTTLSAKSGVIINYERDDLDRIIRSYGRGMTSDFDYSYEYHGDTKYITRSFSGEKETKRMSFVIEQDLVKSCEIVNMIGSSVFHIHNTYDHDYVGNITKHKSYTGVVARGEQKFQTDNNYSYEYYSSGQLSTIYMNGVLMVEIPKIK